MKINLLVILISLLFLACGGKSNLSCDELKMRLNYGESEDSLTLKLSWIGYACGDCSPQYRVDSVLFSEENQHAFYWNKEINIKYMSDSLLRKMTNVGTYSGTCFTYILSGNFRRNGFGIGRLDAVEGKLILKEECLTQE